MPRTTREPTTTTRRRGPGRAGNPPGGPTASGGRLHGDAGEGVISAAIAVLIMAFLGAAMWIGFQRMWRTTETTTNQKVEQIGNDAP